MSAEEGAEGFFDFCDFVDVDSEAGCVDAFEVVTRDEYVGHAEFFGFDDALFEARDGTNFARKAYFACHAEAFGYGHVDVARQDGGDDAEVESGVADLEAAGDVEEDVFLGKFEADTFLEDGEEHVHALGVEACDRALRCAVGGCADKSLHLDEERPRTVDCDADGDARELFVGMGKKQFGGVGYFS